MESPRIKGELYLPDTWSHGMQPRRLVMLWNPVKTYQYLIMGTIIMDQGASICNVHVHILMAISCRFLYFAGLV